MSERDVFLAALEIDSPSERAAYLERACAGKPTLRDRLDALLAFHEKEHSFLDAPCPEVSSMSQCATESAGSVIGRYKILEQIGEGGFATVFMAEQTEPVRRRVALKIIKPGMDSKQVISRFEAERQALALMDHPNIATVFDGGMTESGRPYFAMELVRGVPITTYCDECNLSTAERLQLFIAVCHGVQHAHQKGVIHRDIKPTNVLVAIQDGRPVPTIIDFGVAKATGQRLTEETLVTAFHQIVGTPLYMSPEQAELSPLGVDTRCDVYSLGVLLYELLTGTTPFTRERAHAASYEELRRMIVDEEPPRPSSRISTLSPDRASTIAEHRRTNSRRLSHEIRGDLDWIVMKCLEKDRNRRYESAGSLAEDIRRYLADEPIQARPKSLYYRGSRFVSRNRLPVASGIAVALALVAGIIGTTIGLIRAEGERSRTARNAYAADISRAFQVLHESNDIGQIQKLLDQHRPQDDSDEDLRGWEWRYLWQFLQSDATNLIARYSSPLTAMHVSADGRYLFVSHNDGCDLWDLHERVRDETWPYTQSGPGHFTFDRIRSAGQDRVAVQVSDTSIVIVNPRTREKESIFESGRAVIQHFDVSRDGTRLAVIVKDALVSLDVEPVVRFLLWDTTDNTEITGFECDPTESATFAGPHVSFSPSGDLVAIGDGYPSRLRIYEVSALERKGSPTPEPRVEQSVNEERIKNIQFSPDDKTVAVTTAFNDPTIRLFDTTSGESRELDGHLAFVYDTSFTTDGRQLVSAGADCTLRVWDLQTLETVRVLRGHAEEVWTITRLSDEDSFLSGGKDGTILQWDLKSIDRTITGRAHQSTGGLVQESITPPQHTRDEKHIVALGKDNTVLIIDAGDLRQVTRLSDFPSLISDVWVLPELNWLAISDVAGQVGLYTMAGQKMKQDSAHPGLCFLWALWDNKRLASYEPGGGSVKMWSLPELTPLAEFTLRHPEDSPRAPALINDLAESSSAIATFDTAGRICLWDNKTGKFIRNVALSNFVNGMAFSPTDESLLACVGESGQLSLFDVREPREISQWKAHRGATWGTAFFPDGQRLLTTSSSHNTFVTIWDITSERHLANLGGTASTRWHRITVSPRSEMIVLVVQGGRFLDEQMHVWRAPSWEEIATAEKLAASSRPLLTVEQSTPRK